MSWRLFLRNHRAEWRVLLLGLFMFAGLSVLLGKLWWEQVARGPEWAKKIASRSEVTVRIPSVRGEIKDRNGITLVTNRPTYEVDFYLPDLVRGYRERYIEKGEKIPQVKFQQTVHGMLTDKTEPDLIHVVNEGIIPRLKELKLYDDKNGSTEGIQLHYRNNTEVPFPYREELDFDTIAKFAEHDVGLPGVEIAVKPVRQYLYGALAAHILGYVGAPEDIDKQQEERRKTEGRDYTFYQPDQEGKNEIEKSYDKWMRGTAGVRVMERNAKGIIERELTEKSIRAQPGNNVHLTIDARIQYIAERALRVVGRGAAVVVDPNNGDVLAMASVPSYDPNTFIPSIEEEDWKKLTDDDTDPLINKAIQSYAPGSTYKSLTALAGLRGGIPASRAFSCAGSWSPGGNLQMKCWIADKGGAHGGLALADAIKHSCNCFFYQFANSLPNRQGIEQIDQVGTMLGMGKRSGIPLTGESPGILPSPRWLAAINPREVWSTGYTANTAIGQGSVLASPLQMALMTAALANKGTCYFPRLVDRVVGADGADVKDESGKLAAAAPRIRSNLLENGMTAEQIEVVRDGMRRVVASGTGKKAQIKGVSVAGKTGTAQFWRQETKNGVKTKIKDNHVWFITFAPYENPKYAIAVIVQGAKSGGGVAAPIAQKIMEEALSLEKGYDPEFKAMKPAVGSFAQIDAIDFKSEVPAKIVAQLKSDEDSADHTSGPDDRAADGSAMAKPNMKKKADKATAASAKPATTERKSGGFFDGLKSFFGGKPKTNPPPPQRPNGR